MIVSLHPHYKGDVNLGLCPAKTFDGAEERLFSEARAVVVPQSIKEGQYAFVRSCCPDIFPDYHSRFRFSGKVGNMRLFKKLGLPHPRSVAYVSVEEFHTRHPGLATAPFDYPFVLKGSEGGGGVYVHLVRGREDLFPALVHLGGMRNHPVPVLAQEFVPHGGRDLRVVVVGPHVFTYWRVQDNPGEFRNNLCRGGHVERDADPELAAAGRETVLELCRGAGINLAAVDVVFDATAPRPEPLLLEINFVFGRKGVGGSRRFRTLFREVVDEWIRTLS